MFSGIALRTMVFLAEPQKEVFQAILLDPAFYQTSTGDGEIIFQYKKLEEITSNTIGIENSTQDIGLQYVFNEDYDQTASVMANGMAIKFTTESPIIPMIVSVDENLGNNSVRSNLACYRIIQILLIQIPG